MWTRKISIGNGQGTFTVPNAFFYCSDKWNKINNNNTELGKNRRKENISYSHIHNETFFIIFAERNIWRAKKKKMNEARKMFVWGSLLEEGKMMANNKYYDNV